MLYAIKPSNLLMTSGCYFETCFTLNEKREVVVSVFAHDLRDGNTFKSFVGYMSPQDALAACELPDDYLAKLRPNETHRTYADYLPVAWKNRSRYLLALDKKRNSAIVLIAPFKQIVQVSSPVMKRQPRNFGGFGLVQLMDGELMMVDGRFLIFTDSQLRAPFEIEIKEDDLVDCTSILNKGAILGPSITLF